MHVTLAFRFLTDAEENVNFLMFTLWQLSTTFTCESYLVQTYFHLPEKGILWEKSMIMMLLEIQIQI